MGEGEGGGGREFEQPARGTNYATSPQLTAESSASAVKRNVIQEMGTCCRAGLGDGTVRWRGKMEYIFLSPLKSFLSDLLICVGSTL